MSHYPLISHRQFDDTLVWRPVGPVTVRDFLADAQAMVGTLPAGDWVINLCEDRYHFAVLFAACLLAGKTSLQPASQSIETLRRLVQDYPGAFCVTDGSVDLSDVPCHHYRELSCQPRSWVDQMPVVVAERVVAILFTSGSTGLPQPHGKTWGKLVQNGRAEAQALGLDHQPHVLVGTVPAQHSYGFESTFLLTLHGGCSFWSGKPFYPQDVVEALLSVPQPRLLVTTPHHLTALLGSAVDWPALDLCLSATAALSPELAAQVEQRSGAPVLEIYGSTESSQLAYRRTTEGPAWHLLPGVALEQDMDTEKDTTYACGGHVEGRVLLSDIISLQADGRFLLHGRHADLINMAGKRTSLAYLNCQLCAITGVSDGAFFLPDADSGSGFVRLMAFVVAPGLAREVLMAALRLRIDPIFLPRPLVFVDGLPRNSTGKLPRDALLSLYQDQVARG